MHYHGYYFTTNGIHVLDHCIHLLGVAPSQAWRPSIVGFYHGNTYIIYGSINVQLSAAVMVGLWPWEAGAGVVRGVALSRGYSTLSTIYVMYYLSVVSHFFFPCISLPLSLCSHLPRRLSSQFSMHCSWTMHVSKKNISR